MNLLKSNNWIKNDFILFCFKLSESEASEKVAALLAGKLAEAKVANHVTFLKN